MAVWAKTSVSQIDAWLRCQRFWHYRAIGKIYEPESDDQRRGTDIHDDLEVYQNEGTMNGPYAEYVKVAAPFIPAPKSGVITEFEFEYPTYPGGPLFKGFIDLIVPSREPTLALDYKTRKDARYCKVPEELKVDPQMVSYAYVALEEGFAKKQVEVAHLNLIVGKKPRAIPPVSVLLTEEYVREAWNARFGVIREMQAASLVEDTQELPPNTNNCDMYRRPCFYKKQCGFDSNNSIPTSQLFQFGKRKESPNMSTPTAKLSLIDRLKAAKANGHAAAGAQTAAPIPIVTPPVPDAVSYAANAAPTDETIWIDAKDVQDQGNGNLVLTGEAAALYADASDYERPDKNSGFHTTLQNIAKVGLKIRPVVAIATPVPKKKPAAEPVGVLANDAAERTTPVGTPDPLKAAPEAPAEEPKKRGRPKTKVTEGAASVPAQTASPEPISDEPVEAPKTAPSTSPTPKTTKVRAFDLYIDCFPTKRAVKDVDPTMFEDWIVSAQEAVAEANGVDDYRLIEYGTGKALLSSEVRKRIASVPPLLVVSSMAVGAHEALLVLIPHAANVTKSMK